MVVERKDIERGIQGDGWFEKEGKTKKRQRSNKIGLHETNC